MATISQMPVYEIVIDGTRYTEMLLTQRKLNVLYFEHIHTGYSIVLSQRVRSSIDDAYEDPYTVVLNEFISGGYEHDDENTN